MANNDMGIRVGQACNLALQKCIAVNKDDDFAFFITKFLQYFEYCGMMQGFMAQPKNKYEDLTTIIENPGIIETIKKLREQLNA